jgi:DNA-directed RNA polymerase specialized sigma24 family protein
MDDTGGARNDATPARRPRLLGRFPKIHIRTRAELVRTLQRWRWLLERHAEAEFGPGELADEAVRETILKLLAIEEPDFPHLLDAAMQALRNQCHSMRLRLVREAADREHRKAGALYDPVLRLAIEGEVAEAVEQLPPAEHKAYLLAVQDGTPTMIAYLLGQSPATVRTRLYRARQRIRAHLEKNACVAAPALALLPGTERAAGRRAGHVVASLTERIGVLRRGFAARLAEAIGRVANAPEVSAGAAVLLATAAWTPAASSHASAFASAPPAAMQAPAAQPSAAHGDALASADIVPRLALPGLSEAPKLPSTIHVNLVRSGVAAETPEDVRVTTAATPPRAPGAGPPAIVAVGTGETCQCQVLLQSLDGGVSWSAPVGGPLVVLNQLVLPPNYPMDPRIFGSSNAGVPPFEAASFGAPFEPLALPPGKVAVSAGFDAGDPRLFVAASTGVWSLDMAPPAPPAPPAAPRLEIETASTSTSDGVVAALGTPPSTPGGPALLVWAPNLATVPGSLAPPHLSPTLMACPTSGPCAIRSDVPGLPQFLTVGADAPDTVAAYAWGSTSVFVSRDGGRSFTTVALPAAGDVAYSVAVMGAAGEVWASFFRGATGEVDRLSDAGSWLDATRGDPLVQSRPGALVAVDSHRIVDALQGAGYRCTTTDGTAWTPRCPRPSTNAAG